MISITKKEIDNGAVYKMEVVRNGKCTWEYEVKVTDRYLDEAHIDKQHRDRVAQVRLIKEFWEDAFTEEFYELIDLIPFYKEDKQLTE